MSTAASWIFPHFTDEELGGKWLWSILKDWWYVGRVQISEIHCASLYHPSLNFFSKPLINFFNLHLPPFYREDNVTNIIVKQTTWTASKIFSHQHLVYGNNRPESGRDGKQSQMHSHCMLASSVFCRRKLFVFRTVKPGLKHSRDIELWQGQRSSKQTALPGVSWNNLWLLWFMKKIFNTWW